MKIMPRKTRKKKEPAAKATTAVDKRQDALIKKIARDYKPEMKFVVRYSDVNSLVTQYTNTMFVYKMTDIAQGLGGLERIGDSALIHQIDVDCVVLPIPTATSEANYIRMMLVQDRGFNGTDPVGAAILMDYNLTAASWANFNSAYTPDTVDSFKGTRRYKVLADKKVLVQGTADDAPMHRVAISKKFKTPINVAYSTASNRSNTIFLLIFPGKDTNNIYNPPIVYRALIKYTDA